MEASKMGSHAKSKQSVVWTNDRHVDFLNSMEASFVRTMFENNGRVLRLDRHLPDISDSTQDLKSRRTKNHSTISAVNATDSKNRLVSRVKKTRRISSQPYNLSEEDQVVPQLDNGTGGDKDERYNHNATMTAPLN